ncbi:MAG: ABC transporter permease [Bacteroidaceae bacterium]|nr:ABC transporter permease [Bacteroidaceae bacterium]
MNLAWYMARRLYSHGGDVKRVSRPAIRIAIVGVSLGVAVMIIAVCVVLGFKQEVQNKVMGMGGHIQVLNYDYQLDMEQHPIVVDDSLMNKLRTVDGVSHVQRFCSQPGMLKTEDSFQGVVLKGVGPDYDLSFLQEHLLEGELMPFSDSANTQRIVVSRKLAKQLKLSVGSKVYAYFFDGNVRARRFTVSGIYATHMSEFDKTIIFTDTYTTHKLTGFEDDQFSGAELLLNDLERLDEVSAEVAVRVNHDIDHYGANYTSPTIKELYRGIFSWLTLLDTNVWVILCLMISVAAFTMISGLLIIILERTQFIGTMKALGATNGRLRHLFLYFASFIILKGIVWGNIIGIGIVVLQYFTGIVHLDAETYYVDSVPVSLAWLFIVLINVGTLFVSFLVLVLPSYLVSRIHPAKSIRFE